MHLFVDIAGHNRCRGVHKSTCQCFVCKSIRGENFGTSNSFYGKKHTDQTKRRMRENHADVKGKNNPFYGRTHSIESKMRIALEHKGKFLHKDNCNCPFCRDKNGMDNPFFGKHHSKETLRKLSIAGGGTGVPFENCEYGAEFGSILKEQIRVRGGYKCQLCGYSQVGDRKKLDVHHIDYDKVNNSPTNLVTLCMRCHRRTNFNREYYTKVLYIEDISFRGFRQT